MINKLEEPHNGYEEWRRFLEEWGQASAAGTARCSCPSCPTRFPDNRMDALEDAMRTMFEIKFAKCIGRGCEEAADFLHHCRLARAGLQVGAERPIRARPRGGLWVERGGAARGEGVAHC